VQYQSIKYWTHLFIFFLSGSSLYNAFIFFGYDLLKLRTKQCSVYCIVTTISGIYIVVISGMFNGDGVILIDRCNPHVVVKL